MDFYLLHVVGTGLQGVSLEVWSPSEVFRCLYELNVSKLQRVAEV